MEVIFRHGGILDKLINLERHQDYATIGNTVSLSSRIEGQPKGMARIQVSDETRILCADKLDFVDHGFYKVEGRAPV